MSICKIALFFFMQPFATHKSPLALKFYHFAATSTLIPTQFLIYIN